ncbi:ATP-binding protein [Indioceanicola profundi]|uniref:ATP-binding protein n=1 Tax=Indioceanicola profundi TaxID=2220096 RepID=UPI000E6ADAA3|nr:sensor histidine kinase [Indioceanicola profundi]
MSPVDIRVSSEPLHCEIEMAIPLGLIVNELVTNSLKHAFPDGQPSRIEITCRRRRETHQVELAVSDDGVGWPPGGPGGSGLGTALVGALTAQLGGSLQTTSHGGTCTRVLVCGDRFESATTPKRVPQLSATD